MAGPPPPQWRASRRDRDRRLGLPWRYGRFEPQPGFAKVKPFFDANDDARTQTLVSLVSPWGPVNGFILFIQEDRAWFRCRD